MRVGFPIVLKVRALLLILFLVVPLLFTGETFASINAKEDYALEHLSMDRNSIFFIENKGQISNEVKYYVCTGKGDVFVTRECELIYSVEGTNNEGFVLKETPLESINPVIPVGINKLSTYISYFKGNGTYSGIKSYNGVNMADIYNYIDLDIVAGGDCGIEKIFTVHPGGNPDDIKIKLSGCDRVYVNENGELGINTAEGGIFFTKPIAYQRIQNGIHPVGIEYKLFKNNVYGFFIDNKDWNKEYDLIIDPLFYSTLVGGTDEERNSSVAIDQDGYVYVGGKTKSHNYPTVNGAVYNSHAGGNYDFIVTKFTPDLSEIVASSYIGGNGDEDNGSCLALDSSGSVIITGNTTSFDFPVTSGALSSEFGGSKDVVVVKLSSDLSILIAAGYLGGTGTEYPAALAIDDNDNIFIAGSTFSPDLPVSDNAYDKTYDPSDSKSDAFIASVGSDLSKINSLTYLGAKSAENARSIAFGSGGSIYVGGTTWSHTTFPVTPGAYQTSVDYSGVAFITKFDHDLSQVQASTLFDIGHYSGGEDSVYSMVYDSSSNNLFIAMETTTQQGNDIVPVSYAVRMDPDLSSADQKYIAGHSHTRTILKANSALYLSGWTDNSNFSVTDNAFDKTYNGGVDGFIVKLAVPDMEKLGATYLGGTDSDYINAMAPSLSGRIYAAGRTDSNDFPVTEEVTLRGPNDIFVSILDEDLSKGITSDISIENERTGSGDVTAGQEASFTITVTNNGPDGPAYATVTDTITPLEAIESMDASCGGGDSFRIDGNKVIFDINNIPASGQRQVTVTVDTFESYTGTLSNDAGVEISGGLDPDNTNDTAENVEVNIVAPECNLWINKQNEKDGELECIHSLTWGNDGPGSVGEVVVTDELPSVVEFVQAVPEGFNYDSEKHTVTWNVGTVLPETQETYIVTTRLKEGVYKGSRICVENVARVSTSTQEDNLLDNEARASCCFYSNNGENADISVFKSVDQTEAELDSVLTYTIIVENSGQQAISPILTDNVPEGTEYINATASRGTIAKKGDVISWSDANPMSPGQQAVINICVKVISIMNNKSNRITNTANVSVPNHSDLTKSVSAVTEVKPPNLKVTSEFPKNARKPGVESVIIQGNIKVENNGEGKSRSTKLEVEVTQGGKLKSSNTQPDSIISDRKWSFNLDSFNKDDISSFQVEVEVPPETNESVIVHSKLQVESDTDLHYDDDEDYAKTDLASMNLQHKRITAAMQHDKNGNVYYNHEYLTDYEYTNTSLSPPQVVDYYIIEENQGFHADYSEWDGWSAFPYCKPETVFYSPQRFKYSKFPTLNTNRNGRIITKVSALSSQFKPEVYSGYDDYVEGFYKCKVKVRYKLSNMDEYIEEEITRSYAVPLYAPDIVFPESGQMCLGESIPLKGTGMPGKDLKIKAKYFNYAETESYEETFTGKVDDDGKFELTIPYKSTGPVEISARVKMGDRYSSYSKTVRLTETTAHWCSQMTYWEYNRNGKTYRYKFRDKDNGKLSNSNWVIPDASSAENYLYLYVCCDDPYEVKVVVDGIKAEFVRKEGKYYIFKTGAAHQVNIRVVCNESELIAAVYDLDSSGGVLIDPDGYVYDSALGWGNIVEGASVTCMVYDYDTWRQWPAHLYENQINPQVVGSDGYFAFFTPPGRYYLQVENPEPYQDWRSNELIVIDEIVHRNVPYTGLPEKDPVVIINASTGGLESEEGEDLTTMTIDPGQVVEWVAQVPENATPDDITQFTIHPVIRIESVMDPEKDKRAFDSGMLEPFSRYRYKFTYPGAYDYYYIHEDTVNKGTITVTGEYSEADTQIPTTPENLNAELSDRNKIILNWTASADDTGVTGYKVYRCTLPDESFIYVGFTNELVYYDEELLYSTAYQYYITAVDAAMNESRSSDKAAVTTEAAPSTGGGGSGGKISTTPVITTATGILTGKEMKIIEQTAEYTRMLIPDDLLQAQIDTGHTSLEINLEDIDDTIILEFSKEQLALILQKLTEVRLVTKYGKLTIPADSFPQGEKIELSLGRCLQDVLLPAGARRITETVEFTTGRKLLKAATICLNYSASNISADEEVFFFVSNSPWRPLPVKPHNETFELEITDSTKYLLTAVKIGFEDVARHWARRDIALLNLQDIISGVSKDKFMPDRAITRAEFAAILVRALGLKRGTGENTFIDVKDTDWYYEFVQTAYENGLVSGYGCDKFGPADKVTREQAMAILVRATSITGLKMELETGEAEKLLAGFNDSAQAAPWAKDSLAACVKVGLISGKDSKTLAPGDETTRAEVVVLIRRLLEMSQKISLKGNC